MSNNIIDDKVQMTVMGLSYNELQSGAYALILSQTDGPLKMPIIIGAAEAQSVAMKLEGIIPPRPLTHDLFVSFAHAFGVVLQEVYINRFEDGIFSSELTFVDSAGVTVSLEARTSDAIAIALRTRTPIYTTRAILEETGFVLDLGKRSSSMSRTAGKAAETVREAPEQPRQSPHAPAKLENYALEELERMLADCIQNENYEEAARITEAIKNKKNR